ncbi:hypothetical protein [Winogradskyella ursingii]|uniref:hypothetical protein n=1 Tax=Winogradskyella ursingii TaxID=2686079 RepID=UPI0015CEDD20|nr:hypothetical protein [Winogradskyella ursingii]
MKLYSISTGLALLMFLSCNQLGHKAKEGVNKGGEVVGEAATEFFEGVSEGVEKTLECEIELSKELKVKGLMTGAYSIESKKNNNNNKMVLYIIFNDDFNRYVIAKAFNKNGLEIGRTKTKISGQAGEASYFDFDFDKRTDIGFRNKITLE